MHPGGGSPSLLSALWHPYLKIGKINLFQQHLYAFIERERERLIDVYIADQECGRGENAAFDVDDSLAAAAAWRKLWVCWLCSVPGEGTGGELLALLNWTDCELCVRGGVLHTASILLDVYFNKDESVNQSIKVIIYVSNKMLHSCGRVKKWYWSVFSYLTFIAIVVLWIPVYTLCLLSVSATVLECRR